MAAVITKKTMGGDDLQSLFNQMVGVEEPDIFIIIPKYEQMLKNTKEILDIFEKSFLHKNYLIQALYDRFKNAFTDIRNFYNFGSAELEKLTLEKNSYVSGVSLEKLNANPDELQKYIDSMVHGYDNKKLITAYKELKECNAVTKIVIAARDLRKYVEDDKKKYKKEKHDLEEPDKLSDSFIINETDTDLALISSITVLDFKQLWNTDTCRVEFKKSILLALHLILKRALIIVKILMEPDIDVDKFSKILVKNIDRIRKVPSLSRCGDALNKIKNSVELLKENFTSYYKDFVVTKNPGIIIENFITDVSQQNQNIKVSRQFKMIINYYKNEIKNKVSDPKIAKMFDLIDLNINELENKTGSSFDKKNKDKQDKQDKQSGQDKLNSTIKPHISSKNSSFYDSSLLLNWDRKKNRKEKKDKFIKIYIYNFFYKYRIIFLNININMIKNNIIIVILVLIILLICFDKAILFLILTLLAGIWFIYSDKIKEMSKNIKRNIETKKVNVLNENVPKENFKSGDNKYDNGDIIAQEINKYQWDFKTKPTNYSADEALARAQKHRGALNKRAIDGCVRHTKDAYKKYFAKELDENEKRYWYSAEASNIETDFNNT